MRGSPLSQVQRRIVENLSAAVPAPSCRNCNNCRAGSLSPGSNNASVTAALRRFPILQPCSLSQAKIRSRCPGVVIAPLVNSAICAQFSRLAACSSSNAVSKNVMSIWTPRSLICWSNIQIACSAGSSNPTRSTTSSIMVTSLQACSFRICNSSGVAVKSSGVPALRSLALCRRGLASRFITATPSFDFRVGILSTAVVASSDAGSARASAAACTQ